MPLPRFSWKDSPSNIDTDFIASGSRMSQSTNESNLIAPPPVSEQKNALPQKQKDWLIEACGSNLLQNATTNREVLSTDSEIDQNDSNEGDGGNRTVESGSSGHETVSQISIHLYKKKKESCCVSAKTKLFNFDLFYENEDLLSCTLINSLKIVSCMYHEVEFLLMCINPFSSFANL